MRMLDDLRQMLGDIEKANEWEHKFITDLLERKESRSDYRLSARQFAILADIHQKHCRP